MENRDKLAGTSSVPLKWKPPPTHHFKMNMALCELWVVIIDSNGAIMVACRDQLPLWVINYGWQPTYHWKPWTSVKILELWTWLMVVEFANSSLHCLTQRSLAYWRLQIWFLIICHFIRLRRTQDVQQSCLQAFKIGGGKSQLLHKKPALRAIAYLAAEWAAKFRDLLTQQNSQLSKNTLMSVASRVMEEMDQSDGSSALDRAPIFSGEITDLVEPIRSFCCIDQYTSIVEFNWGI